MNINYSKRTINSVQVKAGIGLNIDHSGPRDRKNTPNRTKGDLICAEPEAEFTKSMHVLASALIKSTAGGHFEHGLRADKLELSPKEAESYIKECLKQQVKSVTVTKVVFKYDVGELASVKIYGTFVNYKGIAMEISSPQIELIGEPLYGWESQLKKNAEVIIEGTRAFLEGKYIEIELPEDEQEEKDAPEASNDDDDEADLKDLPPASKKNVTIKLKKVA